MENDTALNDEDWQSHYIELDFAGPSKVNSNEGNKFKQHVNYIFFHIPEVFYFFIFIKNVLHYEN